MKHLHEAIVKLEDLQENPTDESGLRSKPFDASPRSFKLAAEATRLRLAHLFDPMAALHASDVEPLPHQISAVYEVMLPRQPLRFVLADDPGAGKTVMAGLLIRELMLRGDLSRCLIVAPGHLVEQWRTELSQKFDLYFDILTNNLVEAAETGNPFVKHDLLIARLDQLSRKDEWHDKLRADAARWDLVIVDEAHLMAAHYLGNELKTTRRYDIGKLIGSPDRTRNFLLLTATPHNGHAWDFHAWLALVDQDRFCGVSQKMAEPIDLSDIMRRMLKEDLVTFDGLRLFPERQATTVTFKLSSAEKDFYDKVTSYVRLEMSRANQLERKKRSLLGLALTVLQRRLASSPYAIAQSLLSRREHLESRLKRLGRQVIQRERPWSDYDVEDLEEELTAEELERVQEELVDAATTAKTMQELAAEIALIGRLEKQAQEVVRSGADNKWQELSRLLQYDATEISLPGGRWNKIIIFTEYLDTLKYLRKKIAVLLGSPDAMTEIHGGTRREDRLRAQDEFCRNPEVRILLATDAAREGVNLQVANLMVNYDLPWNPKRIEQRFGLIHRIGQTKLCHLWNLVSIETREGAVFNRLFNKLEQERQALGGKVFDILGPSFDERPLRDLLLEAIRYGDLPSVRAQIFEKVDGVLDIKHLKSIFARNAPTVDAFSREQLSQLRHAVEIAEAKKLQPFYLRRFVIDALSHYGGTLSEQEPGRYELRHVPAAVRCKYKVAGGPNQLLERYERVTFERQRIRMSQKPVASLVHITHPLTVSLIDLVLDEHQRALRTGVVLIDPADSGVVPRLMFMVDHCIREGTGMNRLVSRRMRFVEIDAQGNARDAGSAPYLNYAAPEPQDRSLINEVLGQPWLAENVSSIALSWASTHLVKAHFDEVMDQRKRIVEKTLAWVHERLTQEINHCSERAIEFQTEMAAGKQLNQLWPSQYARARAETLKMRLDARTQELKAQLQLSSGPPDMAGCALVLPQGLVDEAHHRAFSRGEDPEMRRLVERMAMNAVLRAEANLGNVTNDVRWEKCGWDITAITPQGLTRHLQVKACSAEAGTVTFTANEVLEALNQGEKFILAIVRMSGDAVDGPYYIHQPFTEELEGGAVRINLSVSELISRSRSSGQSLREVYGHQLRGE